MFNHKTTSKQGLLINSYLNDKANLTKSSRIWIYSVSPQT